MRLVCLWLFLANNDRNSSAIDGVGQGDGEIGKELFLQTLTSNHLLWYSHVSTFKQKNSSLQSPIIEYDATIFLQSREPSNILFQTVYSFQQYCLLSFVT